MLLKQGALCCSNSCSKASQYWRWKWSICLKLRVVVIAITISIIITIYVLFVLMCLGLFGAFFLCVLGASASRASGLSMSTHSPDQAWPFDSFDTHIDWLRFRVAGVVLRQSPLVPFFAASTKPA